MKTAEEWAPIIIACMQKHPVKDIGEATAQIVAFVEMVQEDCGVKLIGAANDDEPRGAA